MSKEISKYNASGCKDTTAHKAFLNIENDENEEIQKRVAKVMKIIKKIIDLTDLELVGRVQLKDKKTKKVFR